MFPRSSEAVLSRCRISVPIALRLQRASAFYWIPRKGGAVFPSYRAAKNPAFSSIIRLARSVESFNKRPYEIPYCIRVARSDAAAFERFRPRCDRGLTAKRTRANAEQASLFDRMRTRNVSYLSLRITLAIDIATDPRNEMRTHRHSVIRTLDQKETPLPACKIIEGGRSSLRLG